jgi:hypothetical protein
MSTQPFSSLETTKPLTTKDTNEHQGTHRLDEPWNVTVLPEARRLRKAHRGGAETRRKSSPLINTDGTDKPKGHPGVTKRKSFRSGVTGGGTPSRWTTETAGHRVSGLPVNGPSVSGLPVSGREALSRCLELSSK